MKNLIQRRYLLWDTVQPRILAVSVAHQSVVFFTFAGSLFIPLMVKLHDSPLSSPEAGSIGYQFTLIAMRSIIFPDVGIRSSVLGKKLRKPVRLFKPTRSSTAAVRTSRLLLRRNSSIVGTSQKLNHRQLIYLGFNVVLKFEVSITTRAFVANVCRGATAP